MLETHSTYILCIMYIHIHIPYGYIYIYILCIYTSGTSRSMCKKESSICLSFTLIRTANNQSIYIYIYIYGLYGIWNWKKNTIIPVPKPWRSSRIIFQKQEKYYVHNIYCHKFWYVFLFFFTKKKCPNVIAIVLKCPTECFESDGGKNLQIEMFVLQHFFRQKKWKKKMSKYRCNSFEMTHWMSWKRWWIIFTNRFFFSTKKYVKKKC